MAELLSAIERGDLGEVERLVSTGADINAKSEVPRELASSASCTVTSLPVEVRKHAAAHRCEGRPPGDRPLSDQ